MKYRSQFWSNWKAFQAATIVATVTTAEVQYGLISSRFRQFFCANTLAEQMAELLKRAL